VLIHGGFFIFTIAVASICIPCFRPHQWLVAKINHNTKRCTAKMNNNTKELIAAEILQRMELIRVQLPEQLRIYCQKNDI
jgi:hypothetical protein